MYQLVPIVFDGDEMCLFIGNPTAHCLRRRPESVIAQASTQQGGVQRVGWTETCWKAASSG